MSNLDRMKQLMGVKSDTTSKSAGSALKIMEGADGKEYGIFKEGKEYFLKSTEKGSDSFDYVDGLRHKRNYVYESFAKANKQLVSKMHALTESLGKKDGIISESKLKLDMVKPLMTESTEPCQCGGNCQCGKDKKDETIFESTEIVEEMMYEALESATSKDVLKMVQEVSEELGTDCNEYKTLKEFALSNCDLKNLDEALTESKLHQLNKTLSELKMVEYTSEGVFEMAEKLAEEKYKLKVDMPEDEKEDEVDFSMDSEEEMGDDEFGGEAEASDDKPFDDEPFDAGVEASEEEDPKKFIQQLAGKLGQSLREYTGSLEEPDFDLEKFAINSVISATNTAEMSEEDQEDIIAKVKEAGEGDVNGEMDSEEEVDGDVESGEETVDSEEEVSDIKDEETEEEGSEDLSESYLGEDVENTWKAGDTVGFPSGVAFVRQVVNGKAGKLRMMTPNPAIIDDLDQWEFELIRKVGKDKEFWLMADSEGSRFVISIKYLNKAGDNKGNSWDNADISEIKEVDSEGLENPEKADLNKDGKLSDYEKTRGKAIEDAMDEEYEIDESIIEAIAMEALKEMDEVYEEETEEKLLDEDDHPMKKAFKIEK